MSQLVFPVPDALKSSARVNAETYEQLYRHSIEDPEGFWREQARILDWRAVHDAKNTRFSPDDVTIEWFAGGKLNATANCLDRHAAGRPRSRDPLGRRFSRGSRRVTWKKLHDEIAGWPMPSRARRERAISSASICRSFRIHRRHARLRAHRRRAFGGVQRLFLGSASGRIEDCGSRVLITAERVARWQHVPLKKNADARSRLPFVEHVLVVRHTGAAVPMQDGRDAGITKPSPRLSRLRPVAIGAEDPLFVLYTSGSTGKPKGMLHTTGGYLVHAAASFRAMFDYHPGDIHFCTADVAG